MKTVVYQSYRTRGVAPWLTTCMQTVRHWAQIQGFEYRFFGDEFFDHAPPWFRQKAGHEICPVTDLARLVVAKQFLAGEFERAIWIDADVLIFQPSRLNLSMAADFALSLEVWVSAGASGALSASHRVNNSVCVFTRGSIHLDFFIDACLRIAHQKAQLGKLDVGTAFFSRLREILPFPLLMEVGTFGPGIVADIAADGGLYLDEYARHLPFPIACANFCASLEGASGHEAAQQEKTYERAVARCLETQGAAINRRVQGP